MWNVYINASSAVFVTSGLFDYVKDSMANCPGLLVKLLVYFLLSILDIAREVH